MPFCRRCGTKIHEGNAFCSQCGSPVLATPPGVRREQLVPSREVPKGEASQPPSPGPTLQQLPSWRKLLSVPKLRTTVLSAIAKSLAINLLLTAVVLVPGIFMMLSLPVAGMTWLFIGSFALVARCYAKPWKLSAVSCLLPGMFSSASFLVQLLLFPDAIPSVLLLMFSGGMGILAGWLRSRSHEVYVQDGVVMARRTLMYLVIWAAAYMATQYLAAVGASLPVVYGGLLTGAFSTCMLVAVSLVILSKYLKLKRHHANHVTLAS